MMASKLGVAMSERSSEAYDELAKVLGFDDKQRSHFDERVKEWQAAFKPFADGVRSADQVSEEDLAVRINVRDYE